MTLEQSSTNTSDSQQEKKIEVLRKEIKEVYFTFLTNIQNTQKQHNINMYDILKNIDKKKIEDLKNKLKDL